MEDFKDYDYQIINDTLDELRINARKIVESEVIK
jgi:hypothetical protein